ALDANTEALTANMTAIFSGTNADLAKRFAQLWKGGVAQNAGSIGSLFSSALPSLPAESVLGPLSAAEQGVFTGTNSTALRAAAAQMATLAASLTGAIHQK